MLTPSLPQNDRRFNRNCECPLKSILKHSKLTKTLLLILLVSILAITSGCASDSIVHVPSAVDQVVLDQTLMDTPHYTERLLKLLSE